MIGITESLKLEYTTDLQEVVDKDLPFLQDWVDKTFGPNMANLRLWTVNNPDGPKDIYIKTEHKACNVLLYLVLNHNYQKAVLKNIRG